MDETNQLKLQMSMGHHDKAMAVLSNLMKKLSDIDANIIKNMK